MRKKLDLKNQRLGRLVALENTGTYSNQGSCIWLCQCDCGNTRTMSAADWKKGTIKSCGCLRQEIKGKGFDRPSYMKQWHEKNKARRTEKRDCMPDYRSKQDWYRKWKASLFCILCGEDHPACLDFHHREPSNKSFNVSQGPNSRYSVSRILEEAEKCDVLCSNCHRKETWQMKEDNKLMEESQG